MKNRLIRSILLIPCSLGLLIAADWTDYRGPKRDGSSPEKNLPDSWSPSGENLAWKAPYGGRSAPVINGDHLYMLNAVGKGPTLQERLLCLNADTGQLIWERHMKVYLSDVPPHRIAWASPTVDPETGNIYVYGVHGSLTAFNRAGKIVWQRSMVEEQGLVTTHGGRTVSPIVHENLVIVSGVSTGWGDQARASHRYFAFDKKTGEFVWISSPGGRPFDTTYSPPMVAAVNGVKLLVAGGGDGAVHAMQVLTGKREWTFNMSKRGVNTGVLIYENQAIVSHSEENLDTSEMGLLASINAAGKGVLGPADIKWKIPGFQGGYSSPIMDGDRIYQVDSGANVFAFDFHTGKELWKQNLGTIQKATPVLADGKIYVGTENGKFFILKPHSDKCEILDSDELNPVPGKEQVLASAAVSRGRIYMVSTENIYAIGKKGAMPNPVYKPEPPLVMSNENSVSQLQVVPAEVIVKPGETVKFRARLFDPRGNFLKETQAEWKVDGLKGAVYNGVYTAAPDKVGQAGVVTATAIGISGSARLRVIPPLPYSEDFDSLAAGKVPPQWVNTLGKFQAREVDGKKILVKLADNPFTKRARAFVGPANMSNYTTEVDVLATEKRRQMGDGGVVAQRYQLAIFGNHQRVELQSWQPETERTKLADFAWKKDTWYHLKLQVENLSNGKVRVKGNVWPTGEPEPNKWIFDFEDAQGNKEGSPGLYADAPFEVYFDNFKVTPNAGTSSSAKATTTARAQ